MPLLMILVKTTSVCKNLLAYFIRGFKASPLVSSQDPLQLLTSSILYFSKKNPPSVSPFWSRSYARAAAKISFQLAKLSFLHVSWAQTFVFSFSSSVNWFYHGFFLRTSSSFLCSCFFSPLVAYGAVVLFSLVLPPLKFNSQSR